MSSARALRVGQREVVEVTGARVLRLERGRCSDGPPALTACAETASLPAGRGPARVLLVDDDPSIRRVCARILEIAGLESLEAEDGRRGLERARAERPDLVLLDVSMPELDGFELAEALREGESTRAIPFIVMSGEPDETGNGARARELGALAYLAKPFSPTALVSLVAEALGQPHLRSDTT